MMLSDQEKQDLLKFLKVKQQYKDIIKLSSDQDTIKKLNKEIVTIEKNILSLTKGHDIENLLSQQDKHHFSTKNSPSKNYQFISEPKDNYIKYGNNVDIHYAAHIIHLFELNFLPGLNDTYTKLQFGYASDRSLLTNLLEKFTNNLSTLAETIKDLSYHSNSADIKKHIQGLRQQQERRLLEECYSFCKRTLRFWSNIHDSIVNNNSFCLNPDEIIAIEDNNVAHPPQWANKSVRELIKETIDFFNEALSIIKTIH